MFQSSSTSRIFWSRLWPRTAGAIKVASAASLGVLLVILVLVGLWSYRAAVRDAEAEARESARTLAAQILRIVEAGELLLLHQQDIAATVDRANAAAIGAANQRLQRLVQAAPYIFRLFMIDENGEVLATSMDEVRPVSAKDREYFKYHQSGGGGLHVSSVLRSQATGEPIVILSRGLSGPQDEFRGVVLVSFQLDALRDLAQDMLPKRPALTFQVIGPDMQVVIDATPASDQTGGYLSPATQEFFRASDSGVWRYAAREDAARIWAHERVGKYPIYVRVGIEAAQVLTAWLVMVAPYATLSLLVVGLLAALSLSGIRHVHVAERARRELDLANRGLEQRVQERTAELNMSNEALRSAVKSLETLNATNANLAADMDLENIVQTTTDAGVALSGAAFGAFFYNKVDERGESYTLYTISGASRDAFAKFPTPRNTAVFGPTFSGEGIVRSDDITSDPRYGKNPPYRGMPPGHLPVRSYLAVPVASRSGGILGGLFFGHPEPGIFTEQHERLIAGIASQTAIAMDNAQLFQAAQREIEQRKMVEDHQALLLKELSHRVKNSLAVVQAIANQTLKSAGSPDAFAAAFRGRLMALGKAHDLLSKNDWRGVSLRDLFFAELAPFAQGEPGRIDLVGENILLRSEAAPTIAMVVHELATNAAKYGSLSAPSGSVRVEWTMSAERPDAVAVVWTERNGPSVPASSARGFGLTFIERAVAYQLDGRVQLEFAASGFRCEIAIPVAGSGSVQPDLMSAVH